MHAETVQVQQEEGDAAYGEVRLRLIQYDIGRILNKS